MNNNYKLTFHTIFCFILALGTTTSYGQGLISTALSSPEINGTNTSVIECGSNHYLESIDEVVPGFSQHSDDFLRQIMAKVEQHKKAQLYEDLLVIPVVFHVVYEENEENIPDSVIREQLRVLNECFRRENSDTTNLRSDFDGLVSGLDIVFQFASVDPDGKPTSGITHTKTNVKTFGGTLPYGPGQNTEIAKWVNDSMFSNLFGITESSKGGQDVWDVNEYLNIYIGDLRIYEPKFNDFEEILYFGLSTPPRDHENWPDTLQAQLKPFNQAVLMHYNAIGPRNPRKFKDPYTVYNGLVNTGKMLVHEVGHYLGLRHIWGDGGCEADDFVDDTPRAHASSAYACNGAANTCMDTINGKNLPNMIENYMDYSSAKCQNSFTKGQIEVMQQVLEKLRPQLVSVDKKPVFSTSNLINVYPNPMTNSINLIATNNMPLNNVELLTSTGQNIGFKLEKSGVGYTMTFDGISGIYFLKIQQGSNTEFVKLVKQ